MQPRFSHVDDLRNSQFSCQVASVNRVVAKEVQAMGINRGICQMSPLSEEDLARRLEEAILLDPCSALSHSPLSLSLNSSENSSDAEEGAEEDRLPSASVDILATKRPRTKSFRPLTFYEVEQVVDKYYYDDESKEAAAGELDILITYLKGQKNLHMQSKMVCEKWLNALLIPTLLITAAITIFAPFIQSYAWSGGFISGLNASTAFLISLVKYLKLESSVEMFHHTVNQFDKLETSVEFTTSKLMFILDTTEKSRLVLEKIQEIEKKVSEIKEWNSQLIPSAVVRVFPVICNLNIFSFIKRVESAKRGLVAKFKDVKNEIRFIEFKTMQSPPTTPGSPRKTDKYLRRLEYLNEVKEKMKEELIHYRQAYCHIDQVFTREIQFAQTSSALWRRPSLPQTTTTSNPVVDRFLFQQPDFIVL